ncbi:type III secretion T3S chaperone [Chlamydiales bacterium]|nr:type III secretion T3S chaperone [Chlamydiales bacterium]
MAKIIYPLEDVLKIKKKRVEDAERALREREAELEKENERLREREAERDKVKQHLADKLRQFRFELDSGLTTSPKIQQMKDYMKLVEEQLVKEEQKVKIQQKAVQEAERKVEEAKAFLAEKKREVDKLEEHKLNWLKGVKKELELEEAKEQDELGNIIYSLQRRKK